VYGPGMLRGSVSRLSIASIVRDLQKSTQQVDAENLYKDAQTKFEFAGGTNPIKHIVYVIKENRTYDQIFGDMREANGDPSLVMYGEEITPNQHALARRFGILDNFYDSGEVSGNGHVWSTAAITSDYTERIWPIGYRGGERSYDFEGNVSNSIPLLLGIGDVNEPGTGYLWTNLATHHRNYRHYGEFVETTWCSGGAKAAPEAQEDESKHPCTVAEIAPGEALPSGAPSPYPWPIPLIYENRATKRELVDHFDPKFADFNLDYPDQLRADEFIREFSDFEKTDSLPEFMLVRLPNDHTSGAKAGKPTPKAAVADNDLALGRVVEAISHSKYWNDTAIFVLEDDAQDGADHVDSHRSLGLVISKYSPIRTAGPFVESGFYTTVNMVHTMEALLGLPPMNANDAYAPVMVHMFSGRGEQPAFVADHRNEKNGLMYQVNPSGSAAARQSARLDFSHADAADSRVLNRILWRDAKGKAAIPAPVHRVIPAALSAGRQDD
ncbi:MAG: phosphoesterase, partial [Acidobacteriales bacterium]|nr:phosphoesterase [Terriglobales bacterium]